MSLNKALKNLKFDKRMQQQNINNGKLTQNELNKHLQELPDSGNNVDLINLDEDSKDEQSHH